MVLLAARATVLTLLLMAASLVFAEALVITALILVTILMIGTSLVLAPVTPEEHVPPPPANRPSRPAPLLDTVQPPPIYSKPVYGPVAQPVRAQS